MAVAKGSLCLLFLGLNGRVAGGSTILDDVILSSRFISNASDHSAVFLPVDNHSSSWPKCPVPALPICDLGEIPNASTPADVCLKDDAWLWQSQALVCPVSLPETWIGGIVEAVQHGEHSDLRVMTITRCGVLALQYGFNMSRKDMPGSQNGELLSQMVLLKELVAGVTATFILLVSFLAHVDGRRYLQNREIRRRVRGLLLHIGQICIMFVIVYGFDILQRFLSLRDILLDFLRRFFVLFVQRPLVGVYNSCLNRFLTNVMYIILGLWGIYFPLPCGCYANNLKRPIVVTDITSCKCHLHFLKRSVTVIQHDATSEMVYGK